MISDSVREDLLKKLDQLSDEGVREVFDFTGYLLSIGKGGAAWKEKDHQAGDDPILSVIGIADVEPFSSNIDGELSGVKL